MSKKNQVVNRNDCFYSRLLNIQWNFVGQSMEKLSSIFLKILDYSRTSPIGREKCIKKPMGQFQFCIYRLSKKISLWLPRTVKKVLVFRKYRTKYTNSIPAVVSQSASIEESAFCVKANVEILLHYNYN